MGHGKPCSLPKSTCCHQVAAFPTFPRCLSNSQPSSGGWMSQCKHDDHTIDSRGVGRSARIHAVGWPATN